MYPCRSLGIHGGAGVVPWVSVSCWWTGHQPMGKRWTVMMSSPLNYLVWVASHHPQLVVVSPAILAVVVYSGSLEPGPSKWPGG